MSNQGLVLDPPFFQVFFKKISRKWNAKNHFGNVFRQQNGGQRQPILETSPCANAGPPERKQGRPKEKRKERKRDREKVARWKWKW